ncbi:MAG TPA: ROK family transcriptional regulator [Candidatus Limiplasma sp.]|nr:ROK family transcriptional regulator [Candidatus Limiplasma sp.]
MQKNKTSVDASYLRKTNKRLILNTVFALETTSRAELSKALSLSKPAISDNLAELLRLGVVEEFGEGATTRKGGRRPLLLRFNKNHRFVIALDLSYSNPVAVLGNLRNEIVTQTDIRMPGNISLQQYVKNIENGIALLLHNVGCGMEEVFCIAVSSPGVFDAEGNIISQNTGYGRVLWNESRLREALGEQYGAKLIVKNDIKAAALGEWAYGAGQGEENLLYVSCGAGLGAGLVLNGELFEGAHFNAGEIFYYLDRQGLGTAHTLEDRICMKQLIESCTDDIRAGAETCLRYTQEPIGFQDIVEAYENGDPYICRRIERIAQELCMLMFNLGNFLGLNKVIFGGEYAVFGETLTAEYKSRMEPRLPSGAGMHMAQLHCYSSIYGMLFIATEEYFSAVCR